MYGTLPSRKIISGSGREGAGFGKPTKLTFLNIGENSRVPSSKRRALSESPDQIRSLGKSSSAQYDRPDPEVLDRFRSPSSEAENNPAGALLALRIDVPEFTSLCPITGQPDWARIVIRYQPDQWCVESKSLKLYLGGYRNFGEFHESCVNRICNDLVRLLGPHWLIVEGRFTPRGGIPFWPVAVYRRDGHDNSDFDQYDLLEPITSRLERARAREESI